MIIAQVDREMARIKSATIIGRTELRYAFDLQRAINTLLFCRNPISPSRSPKPSGTSNVSPHPNSLDRHLQRRRRQQPHSSHLTALHPLQNGVPFECTEVVGVYSVWTTTPLDGPCVVTN